MMHTAWYCLGAVPYWFSRSSIKFEGHMAKKNRRFRPKLGVFGLYLQFEFTDGYEMMHKDWSSIEESYCLSRLSVNLSFKVTGLKNISILTQNLDFSDCNSSSNSQTAMKWCSNLQVAEKRCPIVFQGHPWNFKVTIKGQISLILSGIECFRNVTPVWIHRWLWNDLQSLK